MAFNNRNNLNPQSAPWGREVEQKVEQTERGLSSLRALTENNNKATNATLGALSRQQDSIIATQTTLSEQQAQLGAAQEGLLSLQATRTVVAFASDSVATTGVGTIAPIVVTVAFPDWATTAIATVVVTGSKTAASNPNTTVSASVYGSDLSGAGTIPPDQTTTNYTQGYLDPLLGTGTFSATSTTTFMLSKSDTILAVSGRGVWGNSPTAATRLRISLTVLFTSQ